MYIRDLPACRLGVWARGFWSRGSGGLDYYKLLQSWGLGLGGQEISVGYVLKILRKA
jgi:hypothetical protein